MRFVKGAVNSLLDAAHGERDEIVVIACRGASAAVLVELERRAASAQSPTGGRAAAHAIELAAAYVTDATVSSSSPMAMPRTPDDDAWADTQTAASTIRCPSLVIDSEDPRQPTACRALADAMRGGYARLGDLGGCRPSTRAGDGMVTRTHRSRRSARRPVDERQLERRHWRSRLRWIAGTELRNAAAGPFNALLLRIGERQSSDKMTIAASFAPLMGGHSHRAVSEIPLRPGRLPGEHLACSESTFFERTAIHQARGAMVAGDRRRTPDDSTVSKGRLFACAH